MIKQPVLLLFLMVITACSSPGKLLNKGEYDRCINKCVKRLSRNKNNESLIKVLEMAYFKANQKDEQEINSYKINGTPDCWDDIFLIYYRMKKRQEKIKPLTPLVYKSTGEIATFEFKNYDEEIKNARQRAADYFYTKSVQLLETKNKQDARKAYEELNKIYNFYTDYRDIKKLIEQAHHQGTTYVLMGVKNSTKEIMPAQLDEDLRKLPVKDLNTFWVQYHNRAIPDYTYDYTIVIDIKNIIITPEQVSENNYKEQKQIQDGWTYQLDKNGNVVKDSSGNDIKIPKYINVTAMVKEVHQFKKATLMGTLDYYDNRTQQLIRSENIIGENIFEYHTATFIGDERALSPETIKKLNAPPKPFPNNTSMVYNAGLVLKEMSKNIVFNNRAIIE
jgi:hypothetical protein